MPTTDRTEEARIEPRVATLESFVKGLDEDIRALSAQVGRTADDTRSALQRQYDVIERQGQNFNSALAALQQTVNKSGHTEWSTLASWAAVILVICAGIGSLYVQPLKDGQGSLVNRVDGIQATVTTREVEELRNELVEKDIAYLREMFELKSATAKP